MKTSPLLFVEEDKCTLCYNCVRVCPVKAIEVKVEQDTVSIIPNRCVGCGNCYTVCPHDAIKYRSSKQHVTNMLAGPGTKVAIVDPSIAGEFDDISDYRKFIRMLKTLGFTYVNGSSFGVDLVAREYKQLIDQQKGKYYMTTTCPVLVSTIEKFHPDLVSNLAPIVSPMSATAQVVRQRYGHEVVVVYIGPCIAAKDEALRYKDLVVIDAVLTFIEIRELFTEYDIKESALEFSKFNRPLGRKGTLYPLSDGLLQAGDISRDLLDNEVFTVEGRKGFMDAVKQFENNIESIKHHFNMFYCEGCLMGPGTTPSHDKYKRQAQLIHYSKRMIEAANAEEWDEAMEEYSTIRFQANFRKNDQRITLFKKQEVAKVLATIMQDNINPNHGCGACGYDSCKEFAVAVSEGFAQTDMCVTYSLRNRQETIRKMTLANTELEKANQQLEATKLALKQSEELALQRQLSAEEAYDITMTMLRKLPTAMVILDENLKILQSNEKFIALLGEDAAEINEVIPGLIGADFKNLVHSSIYNLVSYVLKTGEDIHNRDVHHENKMLNITVFPVKSQRIVGAVFRDLYQPDVQPDEVIARVTEVIEKNLKMVQNIGFLLGEGASEIEQMLNSIIQSYRNNR